MMWKSELEGPDPSLNAEWLQKLLIEKKVKKPKAKWDLTQESLFHLAVAIRIKSFRHTRPIELLLSSFYDDSGQMAAAVLKDALSERRYDAMAGLQHWETSTHPERELAMARWSENVRRLEEAIAQVDAMGTLLNVSHRNQPRRTWRDHCVGLAQDFIRQYSASNGGKSPGLSSDGPVAGFIIAVVPFITREPPPNRPNVAQALRANRNRILR
jgi:hypothetical protein